MHVWLLLKGQTLCRLYLFFVFSLIPSRNKNRVGINKVGYCGHRKYICVRVEEGGVGTHPRAAERAGGEAGRGSADGSRPVGTESGGGVRRFQQPPVAACRRAQTQAEAAQHSHGTG